MLQGFFTDELQFDLSCHYCSVFRSMKLFAAEVLPDFLPAHAAPPRKVQAG